MKGHEQATTRCDVKYHHSALLLIAFLVGLTFAAAIMDFQVPESWTRIALVLAALLQASFAIFIWLANKRLAESTEDMHVLERRLVHLQEEAARRDHASFRVASIEANPFAGSQSEALVRVDFAVYNEGHKDSALLEAWVEVHGVGKVPETWPMETIQRKGPGDSHDRMIRAGDYVEFMGNVKVGRNPKTIEAWVLVARPVLDEGGRGATNFPRYET